LFKRAENICSEESKQEEISTVQSVLKANNYPKHLLKPEKYVNRQDHGSNEGNDDHARSIFQETDDGSELNDNHGNLTNEPRPKFISAPYLKGTSERVQRILHPFNIKIGHKSCNTIRS
jgi:hypothetical protein